MKVEIIRLSKMNKGKTVALFDVLIEDSVILKSCRLIKGERGSFISPASKKLEDGTYDYIGWSFVTDQKRMTTESCRLRDAIMEAVKVAYVAANEAPAKPDVVDEDLPW